MISSNILKPKDKNQIIDVFKKSSMNIDIFLLKCIYHNFYDGVKMALNNGANIHHWGDEALCQASKLGHVNIIKLLLKNGADVTANNTQDPLKWAVKENQLNAIKILLDAGANPNIPTAYIPKNNYKKISELLKKYQDKNVNESVQSLFKPKSKKEIHTWFVKDFPVYHFFEKGDKLFFLKNILTYDNGDPLFLILYSSKEHQKFCLAIFTKTLNYSWIFVDEVELDDIYGSFLFLSHTVEITDEVINEIHDIINNKNGPVNESIKSVLREKSQDEVRDLIKNARDLDLHLLTQLPEAVEFNNLGYVDLSGLTSIPDGVVFNNLGDVYLRGLINVPKSVVFNNKGWIDLNNLTSIPEGVVFNNIGTVFLSVLTSIPDGVVFNNHGFKVYLKNDKIIEIK